MKNKKLLSLFLLSMMTVGTSGCVMEGNSNKNSSSSNVSTKVDSTSTIEETSSSTTSNDKTSSSSTSNSNSSSSSDRTSSSSSSSDTIDEGYTLISDIHLVKDNTLSNIKVKGRVIGVSRASFLIYDGNGKILFYTGSTPNVKINDTVEVEGNTALYGSETHKTQQFSSSSAKYTIKDFNIPYFTQKPVKWTNANVESYTGEVGEYITMDLKVYVSGNYYNAENLDTNSTKTVSLCYPLFELLGDIDFSESKPVTITGFPVYVNGTNGKYVNILIDSLKLNEEENNDDPVTPPPSGEKKLIDIYSINDFHGRVSYNYSESEPGIAKLATFLDTKKALNEDGFVFINAGDYWQDTYESGYNKGKLLTECMDLMDCEAMALGNHEFDWGIDQIKENKKLANNTKFLGANIRKYPETSESVDFADPYKIIERDGVKIGIIGAIGQNQITSITSSNWEDVTFLEHSNVVKNVSDELRVEKDCDVVILALHADESDASGSEITKVSPVSNKKYVDAVFCGHSHQKETTYYNDVPFVQAGHHGQNVSHVQLEVQGDNVSLKDVGYEGSAQMINLTPDSEVQAVVNKYFNSQFITQRDKVHGKIQGDNRIYSEIAGAIFAKASYDLLQENNIDCDIVINNGSRDTVYSGDMTSEKIFNMMPFTNKTLVVENIKGQDIINECSRYSNPYYMPDPTLVIERNKFYTVACIDYMMLHKSANREYNYFPSYNASNLIYTIEDYPNTIIENYLQEHGTIYTSNYTTSNYTCLSNY